MNAYYEILFEKFEVSVNFKLIRSGEFVSAELNESLSTFLHEPVDIFSDAKHVLLYSLGRNNAYSHCETSQRAPFRNVVGGDVYTTVSAV